MRQQRALHACAGERHLPVGIREFLHIMPARHERINTPHRHALLHHLKNDARVFRVILVPRRVAGFAVSGARERRDQTDVETG